MGCVWKVETAANTKDLEKKLNEIVKKEGSIMYILNNVSEFVIVYISYK